MTQLQFTDKQLETVEKAISLVMHKAKEDEFNNPNVRGNAMFLICKFYMERRDPE